MIEGMWALHESRGWYRAAIDLANDAIGMLDRAEPTPKIAAEQLALRMSLARAMMAVRGYGPETEEAYKKAMEVSQTVGTPQQRFPVLRALATYYMGIAQFLQSSSWDGSCSISVNRRATTRCGSRATTSMERPPPSAGTSKRPSHLDRAIELHDPRVHDSGRFRLGPNTGVVARTASGILLWQCGELDRASTGSRRPSRWHGRSTIPTASPMASITTASSLCIGGGSRRRGRGPGSWRWCRRRTTTRCGGPWPRCSKEWRLSALGDPRRAHHDREGNRAVSGTDRTTGVLADLLRLRALVHSIAGLLSAPWS